MPPAANPAPCHCDICGSIFLPAHANQRYCSKTCLWKSKSIRISDEARERYKANRRKKWHENPEPYRAQMRASYAKHREKRLETGNRKFQQSRMNTPWRSLLASRQTHAKQKGLPFDLTEEWAIARWTGRCEITDIPFMLGLRGTGPKPFSPSIDKIDPTLGYTQDNCRFIIHAVNALKGTLTDGQMIEIAKAIVRRYSKD